VLGIRHGVRPLGRADLPAFLDLVRKDPVVNVFAEHRARTTSLEPRWLGGEILGRFDAGRLAAACHVGANLVPIQCGPADAAIFGKQVIQRARTATTVVGPAPAVEALWSVAQARWGSPREVRRDQPHLVITEGPQVEPDPEVRRTERSDLEEVYPACVAMYSEEVGTSPEDSGGADLYRARVLNLVTVGWSFARFDRGRLVFKAEVACATPSAAQIQGVWVPPDRRGEGLATAGMAAVVSLVLREIAPVASLYVNGWNEPARRAYARVGFAETARFTTVML
jgi:uncharacterized protein